MTDDRWVVLGLAHPRAGWFSELAKWSTAATVPIDFIKCVSADEVRARLAGGRAYSALLVGADTIGLDRDVIDATTTAGAAVIVIGAGPGRDWSELGANGVLPSIFDRADLMAALTEHAPPISRVRTQVPDPAAANTVSGWRGRLIAVTGAPGSGTSTISMALAQMLGADASNRSLVALADLARNGELAMLHDAREVVPGLQELVDANRVGRLSTDETRAMTFDAAGRGYHLLLGLRRPRDWTAIRPRSFEAALDGLRRSYRYVVADVDADVEGEAETGSLDVEDRNLIARTTLGRADVVVVTGTVGVKGVHSLVRTIRDLTDFGIPNERLVPVINRVPRSPRRRAEVTTALAVLTGRSPELGCLPDPVLITERRDLEPALRDAAPLPRALGVSVRDHVEHVLDTTGRRPEPLPIEPTAILPGMLGSWTEEETG